MIGVDSKRAEHAAVGDGEGAALHLVHRQLPSLARLPKSAIVFSMSAKLSVSASRITGTTRPLRRADRDRDVDIVAIDDLVAVDRGVDRGHVAQRQHRGLGEEAHEAEADAVLLLEQVLVAVARAAITARHVDIVERGQHRGGVLRFLEAAWRSSGAAGSSGRALRWRSPVALAAVGCAGAAAGVRGGSSGCWRGWRWLGLGGGEDVVLGQAAVLAGALDLRRVEMMLEHDAADRGRQRQVRRDRARRAARSGSVLRRRRLAGGRRD